MSGDHDLVAGVASRDPEAFRTLMERHAVSVINLAYRFLGTVADAEDVAQDVFLRLYQNPPRLEPSVKLSTWLYKVTVNRCMDFLRKGSRAGKIISLEESLPGEPQEGATVSERVADSSTASPRDQVAQKELAALTRKAVSALPEKLRAPLLLVTFEEMSHEEAGRILGISPKAVERRIARARELLKQRLAPYL